MSLSAHEGNLFSIDWSYNYWNYTLRFLRPEVYAVFPAWTSSTNEFKCICIFDELLCASVYHHQRQGIGGLWNEIPVCSLSKGKEGKMQLTSVFCHQVPQWEICWEGLGTQPRRAQMPRAGWPLAYLLVVCLGWLLLTSCVILNKPCLYLGFLFPNQYGGPVSTEKWEEFRVNLNRLTPFLFSEPSRAPHFAQG